MTRDAQRNVVRNITQIFFADVRPLKITFFAFWYTVKATVFAVLGFSKSSSYPTMESIVSNILLLPKIVIGCAIGNSKAFCGAVSSFFGWEHPKYTFAYRTSYIFPSFVAFSKAWDRTIDTSSLIFDSPGRNSKSLPANLTGKSNGFILRGITALTRAVLSTASRNFTRLSNEIFIANFAGFNHRVFIT